MYDTFDFIVVSGSSAGAVIAARFSEDPACRVALLEAGERPPEAELMPVACAAMQLNPATDWMYTADREGPGSGSGDDEFRQDARRILRAQLHGVCARPSGRFRLVGGAGRNRLELQGCAALLPKERRTHTERRDCD